MDESIKQAVNFSLAQVFERMFFTLLEPVTDIQNQDEWAQEKDFVEAEISYTGVNSGELRFFFPERLARSMAANFLGEQEDALSEGQIVDTARESINMAVGNLLGRIDPGGECALAIPKARLNSDFKPETVIGEPGLNVFRTAFGYIWLVYNLRTV